VPHLPSNFILLFGLKSSWRMSTWHHLGLCLHLCSRHQHWLFSVRCYIYISHLCYDVSVHLSVTFVHCDYRVQWIPDIFACLDRWISLLLTNNASPGSSDGMMPGFLVVEGRGRGMEKLVIVAISLNLLTLSVCWMDGPETVMMVLFTCWHLSDFFNVMHYIWRTVCARASHISCYASHC